MFLNIQETNIEITNLQGFEIDTVQKSTYILVQKYNYDVCSPPSLLLYWTMAQKP